MPYGRIRQISIEGCRNGAHERFCSVRDFDPTAATADETVALKFIQGRADVADLSFVVAHELLDYLGPTAVLVCEAIAPRDRKAVLLDSMLVIGDPRRILDETLRKLPDCGCSKAEQGRATVDGISLEVSS